MQLFTVDGYPLKLDIMEELSQYSFENADWKLDQNKLVAASPFREERHPSFFVNLDNGAWGDSGAFDPNYESGNLAKLLAFLRNETYEETLIEYLVNTYGVQERKEGERITLGSLELKRSKGRVTLAEEYLTPYRYRNGYLGMRGISEKVQRFMGIGYSKDARAVTIPWRHADGTLANVKFRQIYGKTFWYASGAAPIRTLIYGIDKVYKQNIKRAVACEAEIDALSWMEHGVFAIAIGGTSVTPTQLDIIRRSPLEEIVIAQDNDEPGSKLNRKLTVGLRGHMAVKHAEIPAMYKDANEAHVSGVNLSELV